MDGKKAIKEGLDYSTNASLGDTLVEMAYYDDVFNAGETKPDDSYKKANPENIIEYQKGLWDYTKDFITDIADSFAEVVDKFIPVMSEIGHKIAGQFFTNLMDYYEDDNKRKKSHDILKNLLLKHQEKEIMLISHSKGSIIACQVLTELSNEYPDFELRDFITMGSPIGLFFIKSKFIENDDSLTTPECVTNRWTNFSALGDFVCIESTLEDEYGTNSNGIKVKDDKVLNDYPDNPHKSYGYLRTPEFSQHLAEFLSNK